MIIAVVPFVACGRTTNSSTPGISDEAGHDAGCAFEPAGASFTFHVKNTGTKALRLAYGCGKAIPLTIDTAAGPVAISTGSAATACERSCETAVNESPEEICSDCGAGISTALATGAVVDIVWDRRVYRESNLQAACVGSVRSLGCLIGSALSPGSHQGTITVCDDADHASIPPGGTCSDADQVPVPFTFDLGSNEVTVDVK